VSVRGKRQSWRAANDNYRNCAGTHVLAGRFLRRTLAWYRVILWFTGSEMRSFLFNLLSHGPNCTSALRARSEDLT